MEKFEKEIVNYIEPVLRFCLSRVYNRSDAEDLASEIILYAIEGVGKYEIRSLDAWVWTITHNRYARYCSANKIQSQYYGAELTTNIISGGDFYSIKSNTDRYQVVFKFLHTLSSEYRDLAVDYYIGAMSVKTLAEKYALTETTVKWRLNVSRQKIRGRIVLFTGGKKMDRVYKRINWEATTCNGSMDSSEYLSGQVARAICEAAYEKPLAVEEISLATGLPTMYIEDALPHLIYGDAIEQIGNKYATNFIVLRLKDRAAMEKRFSPLVGGIADYFEELFDKYAEQVREMKFNGHDFGMARLGYIAVPYTLRDKVRNIKDSLSEFKDGPFPPRKDGGYGWFIVEESAYKSDKGNEYGSGCNTTEHDENLIYYFNIRKYFDVNIYHNGGTIWLAAKDIPRQCSEGVIPDGLLTEDDIIRLLRVNLIIKKDKSYKLNFACFSQEEFAAFAAMFRLDNEKIGKLLTELVVNIKDSFRSFVPKRLDSQINQWVSCFVHSISGYIIEELIVRGILEKPKEEIPLTNGVFYIEGNYVNV